MFRSTTMRSSVSLLLRIGCLACAPVLALSAQRLETGFLDRELTDQGQRFRYQVYVPQSFDPARAWPVVIYLHGAGSGGNDGLKPTNGGLGNAIRNQPGWFPAIVLFPQASGDSNWVGPVADRVLQELDATIREFHGDPDRVYLTGASMGGEGTYYVALRHPGRFAALVVSCGSPFTPPWRLRELQAPPVDRSPPAFADVARRLKGMPLWAFHGEADSVVATSEARALIAALKAEGAAPRYTEYPGLGHEACGRGFLEEPLWPWLFAQRRSRP